MLYSQTVAPGTLRLLEEISSIQELSGFSLAGGTSLALQIGHRISVDLDFFGAREFTTDEMIELLYHLKPLSIISQSKNILILNIRDIKVDFVNYKYPLISDLISEGPIRLYSMPDIAAMKLAAVAGRGRKRDFFDLFFLLKKYSLRQILDFYTLKYKDGSEMMVARSLTFFDDADTDENPRLIKEGINWEDVKNTILKEVKKLF